MDVLVTPILHDDANKRASRTWGVATSFGCILMGLLCACPRDVQPEAAASPPAATPGQAAPFLGNARCPVSGAPVAGLPSAPTFSSTYQGVRVGFMCPAHQREFDDGTPEQKSAWLQAARTTHFKP